MSDAERARQLFYRALELSADERKALLDSSPEPASVIREVKSLLEAAEAASSVLGATHELLEAAEQAETPELKPDTAVGAYRLIRPLGRGGMGTVYEAKQIETGARVALKTIRVASADVVHGIRREIHFLRSLDHPGVVRVLDEGIHDGYPWYAMELVHGLPWSTYVDALRSDECRESLAELLVLVRRLCEPLAYIHGEGLVHRDLKPSNVLVRPDGTPVIVDFGMTARFVGSLSRETLELSPVGGTVAYIAPEQADAEPVDARADLYSLGCMLYEAVTGTLPFPGENAHEILMKRFREDPRPPSELVDGVPPALVELILRLLARDPRERIGYAADVVSTLATLGADRGFDPEATPARSYLYRTTFVGRSEALKKTRCNHLAQLREGRGGMLLIGGESGVGKTRLLSELVRIAADEGVRVLTGECATAGLQGGGSGAVPLRALRTPLQAMADQCREQGAECEERLFGARLGVLALYEPLLRTLPGAARAPVPADLPPRAARLRLFESLTDSLEALAKERPVLLALEDLQWADELTMGWLSFVARSERLPKVGLLVVGTHRREEVSPTLQQLLDRPELDRLDLERLDSDAVARMAREMLGLSEAPADLIDSVVEGAEGNPFFVGEFLRAAVQEGQILRHPQGRWEAVGGELPLPSSIRALVRRRLDGLSPDARRLLQIASLCGREVPASVLEPAAGLPDPRFWEAASELITRQVLQERPGVLRFWHDKLREVTLEEMEEAHRPSMHRRIAMAMEAVFRADLDEHLASLADHWREAGERSTARELYRRAIARAQRIGALDEAERLCRAYLALVDEPTPESIHVRNKFAEEILQLSGRHGEALEHHRLALQDARNISDRFQAASTLADMGVLHWRTGRLEEARDCYEQALTIFSEVGRPKDEAYVHDQFGAMLGEMGEPETAREHLERALAICRSVGARRLEGMVLHHMAVVEAGTRSTELTQQALAIHREVGNARYEGIDLGNLANYALSQGRLADALRLAQEALAVHRRVGNRISEAVAVGLVSAVHYERGEMDQAIAGFREAARRHRENENVVREAVELANLGHVLVDAGRLEEAEPALHHAIGGARAALHPWTEGMALETLGHLRVEQGRFAEAEASLQQARELQRRANDPACEGNTVLKMARLARYGGDLEKADTLLQEARKTLEPVGHLPGLVNGWLEGGYLALCRGESASESLAEARRLANDLGTDADSVLGRAIERLARTEAELAAGAKLVHGELPEDLPRSLRPDPAV